MQGQLPSALCERFLRLLSSTTGNDPLPVFAGPVGEFPHDLPTTEFPFMNGCHGLPFEPPIASGRACRDWTPSAASTTDRRRSFETATCRQCECGEYGPPPYGRSSCK